MTEKLGAKDWEHRGLWVIRTHEDKTTDRISLGKDQGTQGDSYKQSGEGAGLGISFRNTWSAAATGERRHGE